MAIPSRTAARVEPKSQYVSDAFATPFLQPDFDPAAYLNAALPPLAASNNRNSHGTAVPLPELASQTQALLSQLSAQTTRLSNTLTQLTDEIVRSGGRLAYEVEVLRGETNSLNDALEIGLEKDIESLAPAKSATMQSEDVEANSVTDMAATRSNPTTSGVRTTSTAEPAYLQDLRILSDLRTRLEQVIKTFGSAMAWPIAPSEVASTASTFISIASPETLDREEKAKAYTESLRAEIEALLLSEGLQAAAERVEELNQLAEVWRGTVEEKARMRVVDSLAGLVEQRGRGAGRNGQGRGPSDMRYGTLDSTAALL